MTAVVECPDCQGEGVVDQAVRGGRWDAGMRQWYPACVTVSCSTCSGEGEITADEVEGV